MSEAPEDEAAQRKLGNLVNEGRLAARMVLPWTPGTLGEMQFSAVQRLAWFVERYDVLIGVYGTHRATRRRAIQEMSAEDRMRALEAAAFVLAHEAEQERAFVQGLRERELQWKTTMVRWVCDSCGDATPWVHAEWAHEVAHAALDHSQKNARGGFGHSVHIVQQRMRRWEDEDRSRAPPRANMMVDLRDPETHGQTMRRVELACPDLSGRRQSAVREQVVGTPASPGVAEGVGVWMERWDDAFPGDGILLARYTDNDWMVPLMKSRAAVVASRGITGHAPIVARELSKPCVTGVADLKLLQALHGKRLRVDGDTGVVEVLENERERVKENK